MIAAVFEGFEIHLNPREARSATHQGQCDADVAALLAKPSIARQFDAISPDAIRRELAGYGAWDDKDLLDDAANRARILWLAAHDIVDAIGHQD